MVRDMLAAVDTLAYTETGAAEHMMCRLDSMLPVMTRKERALYALLRTELRYGAYCSVKDDTLVFEAVGYFRKHEDDRCLGDALMMQGAVLYERDEWYEALNSYKEAERVMESVGDCDRLGLINARIGEMYSKSFVNSPEALLRKRRALEYFEQTDNLELIMSSRLSLARELLPDSVDKAERYAREGLALADMLDSQLWTLSGYELMNYCSQIRQDYRGIVNVTKAVVDKFGWTSDERICSQIMGKIFSSCAQAYSLLEQPDSARMVMEYVNWQATGKYDSLLACCYIAEAEKDWEALARYRAQAWDMSDSLMEAGSRAQLRQAEMLYNSSRAEAENDRLKYRIRTVVILAVSAAVCIAAFIIALSLWLKRARQDKRRYATDNEMLQKRIDEGTPDRVHLETLGRMLAVIDSLMDVNYRYGNTDSISVRVRDVLREYFGDDKGRNVVADRMMELCDALYPGLIDTVREKCPELKTKEILTVACSACGFSTGTTARLRGISEKSLYVERSRITSKLGCSVQEFIADRFSPSF